MIIDGGNSEDIKYLLKTFKGYRIIPKTTKDGK